MSFLSIADSKDRFVRDGRPFFYLADTAWSAFTGATEESWAEYLEYRRTQGFNALQINILPQWDRSVGNDVSADPFEKTGAGRWNFSRPNSDYFDRARRLLGMAKERGFVPALVLLWCDFVAGTWGSNRVPGHTFSFEEMQAYIRFIVNQFGEFEPLFLVSGDTDFKTEESVEFYSAALKAVKRDLPDALTTLHMNPSTDVPRRIVEGSDLDFYMYQSGHNEDTPDRAFQLADLFVAKAVRRPVVNGEPCYEGHGFGVRYGRFSAFDVRKAIWQSLLAGAKAGVTYGAHGLWNWHDRGRRFPNAGSSGQPYTWHGALRLPGAWDAGFARWLFETFSLFDVEPIATVDLEYPEIRVAETPDGRLVVAYLPYPAELQLNQPLGEYECWCVDMASRRFFAPELKSANGKSTLLLPEAEMDTLFLAVRH